jgi:hypothetical protein
LLVLFLILSLRCLALDPKNWDFESLVAIYYFGQVQQGSRLELGLAAGIKVGSKL